MRTSASFIYSIILLGLSIISVELKPHISNGMDISIHAHKQGNGKYRTTVELNKKSKKLPANMKFDVKSDVTGDGGTEIFHVKVIDAGSPPSPSAYELFPGIGYYKFYPEGAENFHKAMKICEKDGAHLAIINSEAESQVLAKLFARYPQAKDYAYIGFHDLVKEGEFVTIFGEPISQTGFEKWAPGEPNNAYGNQDCGAIYRNGLLDDLNCDKGGPWPFFCEYDL